MSGPTVRYRARVAYDGAAYAGFQRQREGQPTVQSTIEAALQTITHRPVTIIGAGRTDSGVHATGQVIAFDLPDWRHGADTLQRALNASLPEDIAASEVAFAAETFHPRYDAQRRRYAYRIWNAPLRAPLERRYSWHVATPLALAKLVDAAACLLGRHDFATFGRPPQGENSVRDVFVSEWERDGEMLIYHIEANAFLYRMVRSVVGTLCEVGHGRRTVAGFKAALEAADRTQAGQTAPPQGLCLRSVTYRRPPAPEQDSVGMEN